MNRPKRSPLIVKAMSPEVLDQAWRDVAKGRTPWSPDLPKPESIKIVFTKKLTELREEVLDGTYRPCELRECLVSTGKGRRRWIRAQYLRDKLVQRALWLVIRPRVERAFHPHSFPYPWAVARAGQLAEAWVKRDGYHWLYWGRIERFYQTVPQRALLREIRSVLKDPAVCRLIEIELWLRQCVYVDDPRPEDLVGAPEHTVLSPFYLNIYLRRLDMLLDKAKIRFLRIADRFTLFAKRERDLARAEVFLRDQIERLGLDLHWASNWVVAGGEDVIFGGVNLTELMGWVLRHGELSSS